MTDQENEMTDEVIERNFSGIIDEASKAFAVDPNYTTEIVLKAKAILARRENKRRT